MLDAPILAINAKGGLIFVWRGDHTKLLVDVSRDLKPICSGACTSAGWRVIWEHGREPEVGSCGGEKMSPQKMIDWLQTDVHRIAGVDDPISQQFAEARANVKTELIAAVTRLGQLEHLFVGKANPQITIEFDPKEAAEHGTTPLAAMTAAYDVPPDVDGEGATDIMTRHWVPGSSRGGASFGVSFAESVVEAIRQSQTPAPVPVFAPLPTEMVVDGCTVPGCRCCHNTDPECAVLGCKLGHECGGQKQ